MAAIIINEKIYSGGGGVKGASILPWEANKSYSIDDLVFYSHELYQCIEANNDSIFTSTKWKKIGSAEGGEEEIQYNSLPPASALTLGKIYQYIGTTTSDYIKGYFYECVYEDSVYKWKQLNTQEPGSAEIETDPIDFNNF